MCCLRNHTFFVLLAVTALVITGCGGDGASKVDQALQDEWAWLQESKQEMDSMRAERAALLLTLEEPAEIDDSEAAADSDAAIEPIEPTVSPEELEAKIYELSDEFGQRLVGFINDPANAQIVGQPSSERQLAALRLKSSEDIVLAQEYIEKGGDYRRALNIFEEALRVDPDNEDVIAAYEQAKLDRWMSEERFALAEKGMSGIEVRKALGQPLPSNVRPYPEKDVVAWFYPTSENRGAAGVYFNEDDSGNLKVYQTKYEAVAGKEERDTE